MEKAIEKVTHMPATEEVVREFNLIIDKVNELTARVEAIESQRPSVKSEA